MFEPEHCYFSTDAETFGWRSEKLYFLLLFHLTPYLWHEGAVQPPHLPASPAPHYAMNPSEIVLASPFNHAFMISLFLKDFPSNFSRYFQATKISGKNH